MQSPFCPDSLPNELLGSSALARPEEWQLTRVTALPSPLNFCSLRTLECVPANLPAV